jgi:hypothetical protein
LLKVGGIVPWIKINGTGLLILKMQLFLEEGRQ